MIEREGIGVPLEEGNPLQRRLIFEGCYEKTNEIGSVLGVNLSLFFFLMRSLNCIDNRDSVTGLTS